MKEKEVADQEFKDNLKDFLTDLDKIRKHTNLNLGVDEPHKSTFTLDLALRLRDAQHTKSLIHHNETLAGWTKALVIATYVLAFIAGLSLILLTLNYLLVRNPLEHVSRIEKEIAEIRSEVQKVAAQPRNPLGNPLDTESQKDK